MSRKQAICYLIVALLVMAVGLFFLAVLGSVWIMLLVLLLLVLIAGLLLRKKPELFQVFRKPSGGAYPTPPPRGSRPAERAPVAGLILVGLNTPSKTQIVIDKTAFSLGRDPKCDYALTGCADISRVHALIQYDRKRGVMLVTDKNSHNGTYLNNVRLAPGQPKKISDGDLLQLGTLRFAVQSARY
ncbi:MAG: FHA domain-containing protein [Oscillospiraceae bacterium]|nr:FHA domain-containing protein [Oscillospiraceae bacterium]